MAFLRFENNRWSLLELGSFIVAMGRLGRNFVLLLVLLMNRAIGASRFAVGHFA